MKRRSFLALVGLSPLAPAAAANLPEDAPIDNGRIFFNESGCVGSITSNGSAVSYGTASKFDDALRETMTHLADRERSQRD